MNVMESMQRAIAFYDKSPDGQYDEIAAACIRHVFGTAISDLPKALIEQLVDICHPPVQIEILLNGERVPPDFARGLVRNCAMEHGYDADEAEAVYDRAVGPEREGAEEACGDLFTYHDGLEVIRSDI